MNTLQDNLSHSRAAYIYAVKGLPTPAEMQSFPVSKNGFSFSKESQVHSMLIELGWAFFCRYEACLEKHLKDNDVKLSKKINIIDWLYNKNVETPEDTKEGLEVYRKIRNSLHHDDGAPLDGTDNFEIHLEPAHMENFYGLFIWLGKKIDEVNAQKDT
jgi:hypothetical protein